MTNSRKNRFGFDSIDDMPVGVASRRRGSGPMSAAVRDTAETVEEATEAKVAQRQQNATDAKAWREADADGRVLQRVALEDIHTDDLPRDRMDLEAVAGSDEMDELKASIRAHGQKEPMELYRAGEVLQLKKGWRRLTALRALHEETGDERFATALVRVVEADERIRHYIDMVEENVLREDLTFAEMAHVAIAAACDPSVEGAVPEDMVTPLYASLHKMKRSYIRAFVTLLEAVGDDLRWPKAVPRNLGVEVVRALREGQGDLGTLKRSLMISSSPEEQNTVLAAFVRGEGPSKAPADARKKFEFHVDDVKVTARRGELRLKASVDFSDVPRGRLEAAVAAFSKALREPE